MLLETHHQNTAAEALKLARDLGATQAEVHLNIEEGFNINARNQDVETLEHSFEKNLGITVYFDKKTGSAVSSDLSPAALKAAVEKACSIARFTGNDPYAGLADPSLFATQFSDLDLYHPWNITPTEAIDLALECEAKAYALDKRVKQVDEVGVSTRNYSTIYGNSLGFLQGYKASQSFMSCSIIAEENNQMHRGHDYTIARDGTQLDSPTVLAERSVEKAVRRIGAYQIKTTRAPIIFEAPLARGLIANFIKAISGGSLYRKSSFLVDHLGRAVFPDFVQIHQRPHLIGGLGSANYDSEGVATQDLDYIKDGILQHYVLGSYSARKLGMQSTGNANGVHNLFMNHSDLDLKQLLKKMDRGLLVTELMGQGVNLMTGDYSRGAFGFWVENGEIQHPVEEISIAGNLKDMLLNLVAVANDVDKRSNIQTGSILLNEMMIAGS